MVGPILEALERKIGLRRDATRAPLRAPEWQRATSMPRPPRNTQISTRPRLTYCGPKLVLTKGSTLDLRLPDLSGIDVVTAIRTEFGDARIIMLTTFEGDVEIQRALEAGARGYLL